MSAVRLHISPPVGDRATTVDLDCHSEAWRFSEQLISPGDYVHGTINGATVQVRKDRITMIEYLESGDDE